MKNKIILAVVAVAVVLLLAYMAGPKPVEGTFKIGVVSTLTGNVAYIGQSNMKGAELGKIKAEEENAGLSMKLIHEDSLFTPQGGINAYNKLKTIDGIDALVTQASNISIALLPLAAADSVLHIAASTLANGFSTPDDLSARMTAKGEHEAGPALKYLQEKGFKKLGVLYMNNEIGMSLVESLKAQSAAFGISIVAVEGYPADATDFRTVIGKIKAVGVDSVYIASLAVHTATILKQSEDLGFRPGAFVSYKATEDPVLLSSAGKLAEKVVYTNAYDVENGSESNKAFVEAYRAKYNELPNGYAAEAYEAVRLAGNIFVECGRDIDCQKKYLQDVKDRPSILGDFSFDRNGDISHGFFMKTVRDGRFVKAE